MKERLRKSFQDEVIGMQRRLWILLAPHPMENSAPTRPSHPDADRHSRPDVGRRRAAEDRCGKLRHRVTETADHDAGTVMERFSEGQLVAREIVSPRRLQSGRSSHAAQVVDECASVVTVTARTRRADGDRQKMLVKFIVQGARGQRQHLPDIVDAFASNRLGETVNLFAGQCREPLCVGRIESVCAADSNRIAEEGRTKPGVSEQARQDRLNVR
jgi:hypothetical protein